MRTAEQPLANRFDQGLRTFDQTIRALPGVAQAGARDSLVEQLVESDRRVRYVRVVRAKGIGPNRANTNSDLFDPIRAAIQFQNAGDVEEACWMVFLFVHFGKSSTSAWRLARDVYGQLGAQTRWTWPRVSADINGFRQWIIDNEDTLKGGDGVARHFGNHRKYETLKADAKRGPPAVVSSYVEWIRPYTSHMGLFQSALARAKGDPKLAFDYLYHSMDQVMSFGRTAKFDYLTMIGKLGLANIEPGIPYMHAATGPFTGAKLLFLGNVNAALSRSTADQWVATLGTHLGTGMQVMEDAICNWQKSPERFRPFRG
jgi:hypothetical protein